MRALVIAGLAAIGVAVATSGYAGEVFIPQAGGSRQVAGRAGSWPVDFASAARIAAPVKVNSLTGGPATLPPNANVSSIAQLGTNNFALVAQTGGGNFSTIVQQGSGNRAVVSQGR